MIYYLQFIYNFVDIYILYFIYPKTLMTAKPQTTPY